MNLKKSILVYSIFCMLFSCISMQGMQKTDTSLEDPFNLSQLALSKQLVSLLHIKTVIKKNNKHQMLFNIDSIHDTDKLSKLCCRSTIILGAFSGAFSLGSLYCHPKRSPTFALLSSLLWASTFVSAAITRYVNNERYNNANKITNLNELSKYLDEYKKQNDKAPMVKYKCNDKEISQPDPFLNHNAENETTYGYIHSFRTKVNRLAHPQPLWKVVLERTNYKVNDNITMINRLWQWDKDHDNPLLYPQHSKDYETDEYKQKFTQFQNQRSEYFLQLKK